VIQCYVSFTSESYASIKLNIKQFQSNAYHPESQGAVERFHQTLKNMRNTLCLDSQQYMDDGVHMLLLAAREAFHESLRCSPF
jgi:transposase InsO family protein